MKELEKEKQLKAKLAEMPKPIKEDKPKPAPKKVVKLDRDENRALTPEEKAARLEMEKKSDYENARDLFGGIDDNSAKGERVALDDKTFDDFKPKSERDFDDFATFLAGKVAPFEVRSEQVFRLRFIFLLLSARHFSPILVSLHFWLCNHIIRSRNTDFSFESTARVLLSSFRAHALEKDHRKPHS